MGNASSVVAPAAHVAPTNRWISAPTQRPVVSALLLVALITASRMSGTVDSDVSWQLWIAHQINGGAHLYRDIMETNPPLWFYLALPIDRIATFVSIPADAVLILVIGCLAGLSLCATDRLLPSISKGRRTLLLGYAALILAAMPWMQVGQREQIALLAVLPYAALIAARRAQRVVPRPFALLIGIGAGIAFALKHYFLIVPALLELWLLVGLRGSYRFVRPEIAVMGLVGLLYAIAILIFLPDFLTAAVPLILLAYGATGAPHLGDLFQPAVIAGLAAIGLIISRWRRPGRDGHGLSAALTIAALGFTAAYFVQAKGWHYHALPLLGCSALALAALLAQSAKPDRLLMLTAPALLVLPLAIAGQYALRETSPTPDLLRAVEGMKEGDSVGFIATDPAFGWTVTLQRRFLYPSRYNGFWMMRAVVRNEALGGTDPRLTALGQRVIRETVADFRCNPPRRIIVSRPPPAAAVNSFDVLEFFLRDPDFAALLRHYRPVERTSIDVYELAAPLAATQPFSWCPVRA